MASFLQKIIVISKFTYDNKEKIMKAAIFLSVLYLYYSIIMSKQFHTYSREMCESLIMYLRLLACQPLCLILFS